MGRWRISAGVTPALIVTAMVLSGCAGGFSRERRVPPPPPPPPAGYRINGAGVVVAPPQTAGASSLGATAQATPLRPPVRLSASHRQYFDQRHKRYYYYDPARRAYFWEDGTPKS